MDQKTAAVLERLKTFSTPELCDGAGLFHSMDPAIRSWVGKARIAGVAVTVDIPCGEGGFVADAILQLKPGDVLVVAGRGNCASSYWGDHRSYCARMLGAEAVVIDGAFRDIDGCEEIGFPIFARAVTCGTALKTGAGALNVPVSCGGTVVHPGDYIVGDRNGVCVIRLEEAEAVMEKALDKRRRQEETIAEMQRTGVVLTKVKARPKK